MRRKLISLALGLLALMNVANAETYPGRPIRMIVPGAPASASDLVARLLAEKLSKELGQPVVIDDKPGASGQIAWSAVANAPSDGYTIGMGLQTILVNKYLIKNIPFDADRDFTTLSIVGVAPGLMVTGKSLGGKSLAEIVAYAKSKEGRISYASAGTGSSGHFAAAMLAKATHTDMVHVPFKDGMQGVQAVIAGEVDFMFYSTHVLKPLIDAGKLHAVGLASDTRSQALPDVPTMKELGHPELDAKGWISILASSQVPAPIVNRLSDALYRITRSKEFSDKLQTIGMEAVDIPPSKVKGYVDQEDRKWKQLVQVTGIRID